MTPFETIDIDEMVAACAGGQGGDGGVLGHPRVYLNLAPAGRVECPYCSRLFVNRAVMRAGGVAEGAGVIMPSAQILIFGCVFWAVGSLLSSPLPIYFLVRRNHPHKGKGGEQRELPPR